MAELGGGKERLVAEHVGSVGQAEARSSPAHFLDNSVPVLQREWRRPCPPLPLLELARGNGAARSGSEGGGSHGRVSNGGGSQWRGFGDDDFVSSMASPRQILLHSGEGDGRRWCRGGIWWQRCSRPLDPPPWR